MLVDIGQTTYVNPAISRKESVFGSSYKDAKNSKDLVSYENVRSDDKKSVTYALDVVECSDCKDGGDSQQSFITYSQKGISSDSTKSDGKVHNIFEDTKQAILSASAFRAGLGVAEKKDEFLGVLLDIKGV